MPLEAQYFPGDDADEESVEESDSDDEVDDPDLESDSDSSSSDSSELGRVVQVDPIKPTLKALGTHLLTLKCDEALSTFAFNFNLRRYSLPTLTVRALIAVSLVGRCRP